MNKGEIKVMQQYTDDIKAQNKAEIDAAYNTGKYIGFMQKIKLDRIYNEVIAYAMLYRIREEKEYRKEGMTWEECCALFGEPRKTVEDKLKDIGPVIENFKSCFREIAGVPFSKIRYLGRTISEKSAAIEDGSLVVDGVKIPLSPENKEEIETFIDELKDTHKQEKESLSKQLEKEKKDRERIVKAETENLCIQKDALVEENKRLKAFAPEGKDREWYVERMKEIRDLAYRFSAACTKFWKDERILEDEELQGQMGGLLSEAKTALAFLMEKWGETFNSDWNE